MSSALKADPTIEAMAQQAIQTEPDPLHALARATEGHDLSPHEAVAVARKVEELTDEEFSRGVLHDIAWHAAITNHRSGKLSRLQIQSMRLRAAEHIWEVRAKRAAAESIEAL